MSVVHEQVTESSYLSILDKQSPYWSRPCAEIRAAHAVAQGIQPPQGASMSIKYDSDEVGLVPQLFHACVIMESMRIEATANIPIVQIQQIKLLTRA